jgi:hypothetical protein
MRTHISIIVRILLLIATLYLIGCNITENNKEGSISKNPVISATYSITDNANGSYNITISNSTGDEVFNETIYGTSPEVTLIDDCLFEIAYGAGLEIRITRYYHINNEILSTWYNNPIGIFENRIATLELIDSQWVLFIRSIFPTAQEILRVERDFARFATGVGIITKFKYLGDDKLYLEYITNSSGGDICGEIIQLTPSI